MSTTAEKPAVPVPAEREPAMLFKYSTWLHVGVGAEECTEVDESEGRNDCGDRAHFHAWCRLPNPLQQAEIRERALAARARKIRLLRDPETDAYAILQEEFDIRLREGESARAKVIEELVGLDYFDDLYGAMQEVRQLEDPNPPEDGEEPGRQFAHVEDDQARFLRLDAMPESERPTDEYDELRRQLARYQEAIDAAMKIRQEPKRGALDALPLESLMEQLRDKRIEAEAQNEFRRTFQVHEWLACSYRQPGGTQALVNLAELEVAAPEVIEGLTRAFTDLKQTAQGAQGN